MAERLATGSLTCAECDGPVAEMGYVPAVTTADGYEPIVDAALCAGRRRLRGVEREGVTLLLASVSVRQSFPRGGHSRPR